MNRKSAFGLVLTILLFSALAGCGPSLKRFEVLEKALEAEKEKQKGAQKKTLDGDAMTSGRSRWNGEKPRSIWMATSPRCTCSVQTTAQAKERRCVKGGEKTYQQGGAKPYH